MSAKIPKVLFEECQILWNDFDPIGVKEINGDEWNEYKSYKGHFLYVTCGLIAILRRQNKEPI